MLNKPRGIYTLLCPSNREKLFKCSEKRTTNVSGLLHEIIPTMPDATTWIQIHTQKNTQFTLHQLFFKNFSQSYSQRSQPRMDRTVSHVRTRWRPCWWRRRPGPLLLTRGGTSPGRGADGPRRGPCLTCLCGCQTNREIRRLKPHY